MITIANKGIDKNTGLPLSYKRGPITWDEEALVLFVMIQPFITYPSGLTSNLTAIRQIIQDDPAVIDVNGNITTPADLAYTNYATQFNFTAIGAAIDTYIANLIVA
jgi:hypothetical protein